MHNNMESTSNSIKFAPMPMSQLMANLMPLQKQSESFDSSYSTNESDNSTGETVSKEPSPHKKTNSNLFTSTPKYTQSKDIKTFASEKKTICSEGNKENRIDVSLPNRTYHNKDSHNFRNDHKNIPGACPSSEMKSNVLATRNDNARFLDTAPKNTPEAIKVPNVSQKVKIVTPKIKSGIRRFTPSTGKWSQKKTPQKLVVEQSKERVRCLFPDSLTKEDSCPPPPAPPPPQTQQPQPLQPLLEPVPETPLNKKPMPASYAATPSYPQGVVGQRTKMLFKTTSIKGKEYLYLKKLGTGGSSEVYKVFEVATWREYAVKCVDLATDQELAKGYINEVRLLRELQNSDRVVRLYDYEYDRSNKYLRLVLELGETDLSSVLKARGAGLAPTLVLHYWNEMLHAVNYIHEHGVIHADLKPANFLLVCGHLKLIDFGIASAISSDATSVVRAQAAGTYSYISPEALMGGAGGYGAPSGDTAPIKISFRSDVWSLGCILYSMVYGRTPFGHIQNLAKLAAILDPNHRIDYPPVKHLPQSLIEALKWCLTYNARSRPSVRELLSIPYLQSTYSSLPQSLLDKLQQLLPPHEFKILQRA